MAKYLLTDSILSYMREKYPYELYEADFSLFEKSIEQNESIITDETKRNLAYNLQNEEDIDYYTKRLKNPLIPDEKILAKLCKIINSNPNFNFLNRDIVFGIPTPIPFIIATAIEENLPIVIDENDKDQPKYKKLCDDYGIEIYSKTKFIKALRENNK